MKNWLRKLIGQRQCRSCKGWFWYLVPANYNTTKVCVECYSRGDIYK